jgi:addiction module RelE/StbE family toxin
MKIKWSPLSVERLTSIVNYISEDKPIAAKKLVGSIIESIERLKEFPKSGRIVPELENPRYRELLVKNYRIIYSVIEDVIYILTIRHQVQLLNLKDIK